MTTATRTRTALGYVRISQDRTGERLGVQRQAQAVRDLATTRGLSLVEVVEENDTSATKGERERWSSVLARLAAGEVDVLVVYALDRAVRRRRDVADLLDACAAAGVDVEAVNGGSLATSTPAGRMAAGMIGTVAQAETETMAARMRAANEQRAARGVHRPRGTRTYGYTRAGEPVEDELAVVREVFARLAAGEPVYRVSADLADRGLRTTRGGPWSRSATYYIARNDRYLGRSTLHRMVNGKRVPVLSGETASGPVVDEGTFARVQAVLAGRPAPARPAARWLLVGGVGRCHCGAPLTVYGRADRTFYRCAVDGTHGSRLAARIDAAVVAELVLPRLTRDAGVRPRADHRLADAERSLADLDRRADDLAAAFAAGDVTAAAYGAATKALDGARRAAEAEVARYAVAPVLDVPAGATAAQVSAAWESLPVEGRREVIRRLYRITLHRSGRGRRAHPLVGVEVEDVAA